MSPALVVVVLVLCVLRLRKLVRDERRHGLADMARKTDYADKAAFVESDPVDWDRVIESTGKVRVLGRGTR